MSNQLSEKRRNGGATLVELMIGIVLSTMLLAMTGSLWLYGSRSLGALDNYRKPDTMSYKALHLKPRGLSSATPAAGVTNTAVGKALACAWSATPPALVRRQTSQPDRAASIVPVRSVREVHGETAETRGAP